MSNKDMPAYPSAVSVGAAGDVHESSCWGFTKLEAFTMAALQGLCANGEIVGFGSSGVARIAVEAAEATLAELEKRNG